VFVTTSPTPPCWRPATGLRNLPFFDFGANDAWLTLVMIAQTLVCWAQTLLLPPAGGSPACPPGSPPGIDHQ
jgi:hypothetical protein